MKAEALIDHVPPMRRYARMFLGDQALADDLVARALLRLASGGPLTADLRTEFFRALHMEAPRFGGGPRAPAPESGARARADERLQALPPLERAAVLLLTVEELPIATIGAILRISERRVVEVAHAAQEEIERRLKTTVLIIEDEWTIADDLRQIVCGLGHEVVAVAPTKKLAVELAADHSPGLVIADLRLSDGSSGADAVRAISERRATPAVFVTAFPEAVARRERSEPTYLIAKPYSPPSVRMAVSRALFFA